MIPTLDLFSGVGGFSYALKDICKTVGYCEIDLNCRLVLEKLMREKKIDTAPIFEDITKLHAKDIKSRPNMITAGFPCQDISRANTKGLGINGPRSGLFFEICRLIDELKSIDYVFLENSPNIQSRGLERVEKEFRKRNYQTVWNIFDSKEYGASHSRRRWFFLAYKKPLPIAFIKNIHSIGKNPTPKLVVKRSKAHIKRCSMLGNSVVPKVVQIAWNSLNGETYPKNKEMNEDIVFKDGNSVYRKSLWATPTHVGWIQHRKICDRATRILINQIMYSANTSFEKNIPVNMRDRYYSVNANFVEHLMGYPNRWTKL
jgi:DNA (cytosine-5)-methyltransferase 1